MPPDFRLGETRPDGIAAAIYALIERGALHRPALARQLRGRVVFRFTQRLAPVRVAFDDDGVLVEDGDWPEPDLVIAGPLTDVVRLTTTPLVGGMPNPVRAGGRAALAGLARGRVRISGDRTLGRRLLELLKL
jgi:hypothetical protein